ncbi:MAG: hypothetical protein ACREMV_07610, partial [Gemmatimonadales bacterium]
MLAATVALGACDAPEPTGPADAIATAPVASQAQQADWFAKSSPEVLAIAGTVFADHDEVSNRLVFGVERAAVSQGVRNALARLGIPASAYMIKVTEPIYMAASLRDRFRPTVGGIQIHFGQFLCTLGFNADDGAERSFITASHCTKKQGGVQSTEYF